MKRVEYTYRILAGKDQRPDVSLGFARWKSQDLRASAESQHSSICAADRRLIPVKDAQRIRIYCFISLKIEHCIGSILTTR
jgi:hypothetical protein